MKKILSLILCGMLMLGVLLTAVGCSSEQSKFVGTWEATLDLSDVLKEQIAGQEIADYLEIKDFAFVMRFTFEKDGSYEAEFDEDSVEEAFDNLKDQARDAMTLYMEDLIAQEGLDMTVEEVLAASGIDMDAAIEESFTEDMFDEMMSELTTEGEFKAEDGKLYLFEEGDDPDEDEYIKYEFDDEALVLKKAVTEDEEYEEMAEYMFPLTFEKVD